MHTYEKILRAVSRGWCDKKNQHKVMDSDLAVSIAKEVYREISGISSKEVEPRVAGAEYCPMCHEFKPCSCVPKPPVEREWCEHTKWIPNGFVLIESDGELAIDDWWKFCPICSAPRPTEVVEKSLEERIIAVICREELMPAVCEDSGMAEWSVGEARKLAKAIIAETEEHYGEKK